MTEFDELFLPLASELLAEYGKQISFTPAVEGTYNPATGRTEITGNSFNVFCVIEEAANIRANLVEGATKRLTVAGEAFATKPDDGDIAGIDGENYSVKNVVSIYSGELVAAYQLEVGK